MRKKKIVVTVSNDLNQDQRMHRICNSLSDDGYDVLFVGRKKKNSSKLLKLAFDQKRLNCLFQRGFLFYAEFNIRLFIFLIFSKWDALYSVDLDTLIAGGIVSRMKNKVLIHDAHEYFTEVPELSGKPLRKAVWNKVANTYYKKADLLITVNNELAQELSSQYDCKFEVVQSVPVLNLERKSTNVLTKPYVVLYQGMLNQGRGLEEAMKAVIEMNIPIEMWIAGEGDLSDHLRSIKKNHDHEDRVKFLGWKTPSELSDLTQKAWIGLNLLSSDSLNYQFSLANKFFDYMHADVPSINMNYIVYDRIIREHPVGTCIENLDIATIKDAIENLYQNPIVYKEMVENCDEAKRVFNWQKEEKNLKGIIAKINRL